MRVTGSATAAEPELETIHVEINDGCGEESQKLAENEAADDGDTERATEFGAGAMAEGERERAEERCHGGHENWPETQQARLVNGFDGREAFLRFRLHGEVNHEDGVFLDDADEQNNADQCDEREFGFEKHHGEERADSGGRKRGKNGDGMNKTFIEDAENDVDRCESRDDKNQNGGLRILEGLRGALKTAM